MYKRNEVDPVEFRANITFESVLEGNKQKVGITEDEVDGYVQQPCYKLEDDSDGIRDITNIKIDGKFVCYIELEKGEKVKDVYGDCHYEAKENQSGYFESYYLEDIYFQQTGQILIITIY